MRLSSWLSNIITKSSKAKRRPRRHGQCVEALEARQLLTTFVVNDDGGGDFLTIQAAINDGSVANGDTLQISGGADNTHTEQGINVSKDLTIEGLGQSATIIQAAATAGTATDRVFSITTSSQQVVIQDMTIRHGNASSGGGAISNDGTLSVNRTTISGNTSGGNGGGLSNSNGASMTVTDSTVSANSASRG